MQIVSAISDRPTYIFITKQSKDAKYHFSMSQMSPMGEIFIFIRHQGIVKRLFLKFLSKNTRSLRTVFGCNTEFYYDVLSLFNSDVRKIDLIHAFATPDYGIEQYSLPSISILDARVVINLKTKQDLIEQYKYMHVNDSFVDRIITIENAVENLHGEKKILHQTFKVGYIGRWAKEKRPELFISVGHGFKEKNADAQFIMAGFNNFTPKTDEEFIDFKGILNDAELVDLYRSLDVLLVTSYREGMPLAIIEAMLYGVVVIATSIGSIEEHIIDNETGFIVNNSPNEDHIVVSMRDNLQKLYDDRSLLERLSLNSYNHAQKTFKIEKFYKAYKNLLLNA
ncbi:glycosyltransferase family 4 protein [Aestuariivivens sediminicola]|uniref:glycosyltransferase family 4 protein n=1 Tax=Aestuariivivens sediminicola TaxID=2913560 RepID=UPI001F561B8B|nr:glycosyltransferase family 4 protein [Aestuariivivens sediminicola]